jgi:hypothetical protein
MIRRMEAAYCYETLIQMYQPERCHIQEDRDRPVA